jgi:lysophospholipase L1-like esterase
MPHHELHVKYLLSQYPRIDAVILLVGVNDLQFRLGLDSDYRAEPVDSPEYDALLMQQAFSDVPRRYRSGNFYQRTEIWRMLRTVKRGVQSRLGADEHDQDTRGVNLAVWRAHRRAALNQRQTLPDLQSALDKYHLRLRNIIDGARRFHARVILMTQPAMWRADLPPELLDLLWMGGIGDFQGSAGRGYYAAGALAEALGRYNQTLLDVCRETSAECIDLAAAVPRDTSAFFDDVHFNEAGSKTVARITADYLLSHANSAAFRP